MAHSWTKALRSILTFSVVFSLCGCSQYLPQNPNSISQESQLGNPTPIVPVVPPPQIQPPQQNTQVGAPAVTAISGNLSSGSILTISGSNLIKSNSQGWQMTENQGSFEGNNQISDGWLEPNSGYGGRSLYDTNEKILGNQSFKSTIFGGCNTPTPAGNCVGEYLYKNTSGPVVYVRGYVKFSPSYTTVWTSAIYSKMFYWMSGGVYVQPHVPNSVGPRDMTLKIQGASTPMPLPSEWTTDRWYCVEAKADRTLGEGQVWIDGVSIGKFSSPLAADPGIFLVGIINANGLSATGTFSMWTDGLMLSSSRVYPAAIVEVGDSSNYQIAQKVVQEVTSLSDNSIRIKYSESGFNLNGQQTVLSGSSRFIFITNNSQVQTFAQLR